MICDAPYWVTVVIDLFNTSMISEDTILNAINWLIGKGIVVCNNQV